MKKLMVTFIARISTGIDTKYLIIEYSFFVLNKKISKTRDPTWLLVFLLTEKY